MGAYSCQNLPHPQEVSQDLPHPILGSKATTTRNTHPSPLAKIPKIVLTLTQTRFEPRTKRYNLLPPCQTHAPMLNVAAGLARWVSLPRTELVYPISNHHSPPTLRGTRTRLIHENKTFKIAQTLPKHTYRTVTRHRLRRPPFRTVSWLSSPLNRDSALLSIDAILLRFSPSLFHSIMCPLSAPYGSSTTGSTV